MLLLAGLQLFNYNFEYAAFLNFLLSLKCDFMLQLFNQLPVLPRNTFTSGFIGFPADRLNDTICPV